MHALPSHLNKLLHSEAQSSSGFQRQERYQSFKFRLLCAFASRWSGTPNFSENAATAAGRAAVSSTLDRLLLNLPMERYDALIQDILGWLAEICKNAGIRESWFDDEFLQLIDGAADFVEEQYEIKKTVDIPAKQIQKVEMLMRQMPVVEEPEEPVRFDVILPKCRGEEYIYQDESEIDFYKNTHNPLARPINVLQSAQHKAVSSYNSKFRDVHERVGINYPFHARTLSAPYCYSLNEADAKMQLIDALEVGQSSGRVLSRRTNEQLNQLKQQTMINDAMNDCQRKIEAYQDGRMRSKALKTQERESLRYCGKRTFAHRTQAQYYYGYNNKKTTVFDDQEDQIPRDGPRATVYDDILEVGHEEDFTGLGLSNLEQAELRTRAGLGAAEDDYLVKEGDEVQRPRQSGYLLRKAVVSDIIGKTSIPMFDRKIAPLDYVKDTAFHTTISPEEIESEILSGGPHKLDPRVYQVMQTAKLLTDNKDLDIQSDSDECIDDPCFRGGLEESDMSEGGDGGAEPHHEMLARAGILDDFKSAIQHVFGAEIPASATAEFFAALYKKKSYAARKEKEEFDAAEAARAKEAKKKEIAFKPKKFVSQTAKSMHKTASGAPSTTANIAAGVASGVDALRVEKAAAYDYMQQIDAEIGASTEKESEYSATLRVSSRKTQAAELLKVSQLMREKDSDAPKKIISSILFRPNFDPAQSPSQVVYEAAGKVKNVNYDLQEPNVYGTCPTAVALSKHKVYEPEALTEADQPGVPLHEQTYLPVQAAARPSGTAYNSVPYSAEKPIFQAEFGPKTAQQSRTAPSVAFLAYAADRSCLEPRIVQQNASAQRFLHEQQRTVQQAMRQLHGAQDAYKARERSDLSELQQNELVDRRYFSAAAVFQTAQAHRPAPVAEQAETYQKMLRGDGGKGVGNSEIFVQNVRRQNQIVPSLDLLSMQLTQQRDAQVEKELEKFGIRVVGATAAGTYKNYAQLEAFCGLAPAIGPSTAPRVVPKKAKGKKGKGKKGKQAAK